MESITYLQHTPFFTFTTGVLDSQHFARRKEDSPLRILEVGCGSGEFSVLLKRHYKQKVELIAIDPSEDDIKAAQTKTTDVTYIHTGLLNWQPDSPDTKFDVIICTKSLHHCDDLERVVKRAYDLLVKGGILLAEELQPENMNVESMQWLFDRFDLLQMANLFNPADLRSPYSIVLDTSIPAEARWLAHLKLRDCHSSDTVKEAVTTIFGRERTRIINKTPFIHYYLVKFGLKDSAIGKSVLSEFMAQEDRALASDSITSLGFTIVAEK
ncbi:S-adenosyl-L-methionine-dependent methyltransferase [Halteromyces radiatus]|uniref:S-adenosyl-L-methionine-dependent methyltransferase n=1 Tax=Halteromyces radiatus TaxID=101107 RepID=UPI00221F80B6|nr:S-adenosyl-L-methionine-dependent methyltransferase [Halteromyces radiatus]KAI8099906.1 S-adenosyl-L-methionine-dependent methyltransferase [Halteromyces radiatus]